MGSTEQISCLEVPGKLSSRIRKTRHNYYLFMYVFVFYLCASICVCMWGLENNFGCCSQGYCLLYSETGSRCDWLVCSLNTLVSVCLVLRFQVCPYNNWCFYVGSVDQNQGLIFEGQGFYQLSYIPSPWRSLFDCVSQNHIITAPGYTDREAFPPFLLSTMDRMFCAMHTTPQECEFCVCPAQEHAPHMGTGNLKKG